MSKEYMQEKQETIQLSHYYYSYVYEGKFDLNDAWKVVKPFSKNIPLISGHLFFPNNSIKI